jgi:tetratricopeptide (TPR) repeat protein
MVDELSAAVRRALEIERPAGGAASITSVTTSSLAALRMYTEATVYGSQSRTAEAIALLEKALDEDPTYALALVYLGSLHENLGHTAEANEYSRRAFELADRLPLDQRYRIEGTFYST